MRTHPDDVFLKGSRPRSSVWTALLALVFVSGGGALAYAHFTAPQPDTRAMSLVERRQFKRTLRRTGVIWPLNEDRIYTKLAGTILEIAYEGSMAQKGDVVLRLDPRPNEDLKAEHEELMGENESDYKRAREESLKTLNLAKEDVKSYDLRLTLEQMRLNEILKGPTPADEVNAQMNLDNNKILLTAKEEETAAISSLAKLGYASVEEMRQKQTETVEQHFKVLQMDIAHRKLNIIDPVKVADQALKVKEATKTRDAAKAKVDVLNRNIARDDERYRVKRKRDEDHLKELVENIAKTVYCAPCAGLVVPRRASYGFRYAPGREVYDGMELLTIPDLSAMKVKLTVDEGHISRISMGMKAQIVPAGWTGAPFEGKVIKISDQGRDEFEQFQDDTTQISGTANRKVFEVEVELNSTSPILRMGLRCDVEIVLNQIDNAIVVPRAALIRQKDGDVLAPIAGPDGSTVTRKIKVKDEGDLWAAVEGLEPGERLVLTEGKAN